MGELDIISKRILKRLLLDIGKYLCGLNLVEAELMATEEQRIEDRRSDLVARVKPERGESFVLHIEIQNSNDPRMVSRMLRYRSDIQLAYPDDPVFQCVIYTGS
ncbi:MAG: hypothetical protein ACRESZ_23095, partial [Methylococcales bacterium]